MTAATAAAIERALEASGIDPVGITGWESVVAIAARAVNEPLTLADVYRKVAAEHANAIEHARRTVARGSSLAVRACPCRDRRGDASRVDR
jgi:deoxycytidylate deaminase